MFSWTQKKGAKTVEDHCLRTAHSLCQCCQFNRGKARRTLHCKSKTPQTKCPYHFTGHIGLIMQARSNSKPIGLEFDTCGLGLDASTQWARTQLYAASGHCHFPQ